MLEGTHQLSKLIDDNNFSNSIGTRAILHPPSPIPTAVRRVDVDALRPPGEGNLGEQPTTSDSLHEPGPQRRRSSCDAHQQLALPLLLRPEQASIRPSLRRWTICKTTVLP